MWHLWGVPHSCTALKCVGIRRHDITLWWPVWWPRQDSADFLTGIMPRVFMVAPHDSRLHAVRSQISVSVYFTSEQILPFGFAELPTTDVFSPAPWIRAAVSHIACRVMSQEHEVSFNNKQQTRIRCRNKAETDPMLNQCGSNIDPTWDLGFACFLFRCGEQFCLTWLKIKNVFSANTVPYIA